jgi:hypothetical protein
VAPRAYWKGFLKLSLVSCPISLFPATSEREKVSFHQLNKDTGHRIRYRKGDAESGDEVEQADIIKGYDRPFSFCTVTGAGSSAANSLSISFIGAYSVGINARAGRETASS